MNAVREFALKTDSGKKIPCRTRGVEPVLVGWYTKPSRPQRITSGLKTNVNPSTIYSAKKP